MAENFQQLLLHYFPQHLFSEITMLFISFFSLLLVGGLLYFIAKGFVLPLVKLALARLNPPLIESIQRPLQAVIDRLSLMAPLIFYLASYDWFVSPDLAWFNLLNKAFYAYLYVNVGLLLISFLNIAAHVYNQQTFAKDVPIDGMVQIAKLLVFLILAVLTISEFVERSPIYLLSSLGALTAILLLIFKDTILGLVAGIQIATQRLVAIGDWIEMPQYGADGDVLEVGLHTVRVQNFDKTITTIPTYKLISDSFKNWRGMANAAGRRIKRAVKIDINSITFIDAPAAKALLEHPSLGAFCQWLQGHDRAETNMGLFRQYCEFYLIGHPKINQEMTLMARQLAPTENGVALEVYCFCADKRWVEYEKVQAEVLEHLLARLSLFGLRAYQRISDRTELVA